MTESNANDVKAELASLKTEVRYLKWIIPAACGFVAILVLIFWGIERQNIGGRVSAALDEAGVNSAIQQINGAREKATSQAVEIQELLKTLPVKRLTVMSNDHSSGIVGQYFNFDVADLDQKLGMKDWNDKNFTVMNSRTGQIGAAVLWRTPNGGSAGDGHGRFATPKAGQWQGNDTVIILLAPTKN